EQLGEASGVRAILISEWDRTSPVARVTESAIAIAGLAPQYLNNAVAALRLSSLPAAVWWRGGSVEALDDLADLADRFILDTEQPDEAWQRAGALIERTALTDLRWAGLTRWRAALAHMFDLPQVRTGAASIRRLYIEAADPPSARLFAGWLRSSLKWSAQVAIEIQPSPDRSAPLHCVTLTGDGLSLSLDVKESRTCLEAVVNGIAASARVVPLAEGTLVSLIAEELGVRTRDLAFERALAGAREISA
ncbi:MAG TPA: OpcA/G6PD domain-containing protein, partial [Vicinamibacterales bacterium]|nr:OpcA/G6PD domain-containing protein [Vicinamibacterales bacterium]